VTLTLSDLSRRQQPPVSNPPLSSTKPLTFS